MTERELLEAVRGLRFSNDTREVPNPLRRGQFQAGWGDATDRGIDYTDSTLSQLTWHNLGYRLGKAFGKRTVEEIGWAYDVIAEKWMPEHAAVLKPNQEVTKILNAVARIDVTRAIEALDAGRTHDFGPSRDYDLVYRGRRYPPKAVIAIAAEFAAGKQLSPSEFSSGIQPSQACGRLHKLGFGITHKGANVDYDSGLDLIKQANAERQLVRWQEYSRAEVHGLFAPGTTFTPQSGEWGISGTIELDGRPGDFVFFVTLGQSQAHHTFDEGITLDGVLSWQSQPGRKLDDKQIAKLTSQDPALNDIFLFLRPEKSGPYIYVGKLKYLWHDPNRQQPVWFHWHVLEWDAETAKLPAAAYIDAVSAPELPTIEQEPDVDGKQPKKKGRGQGLIQDSRARLAIERRAMEVASQLYAQEGFVIADTSNGNPFDLRCTREAEVVHVEVKGTMSDGAAVFVTVGEVNHARRSDRRTDLIIVGHIQLSRVDGVHKASGGIVINHAINWKPLDEHLEAMQFRYRLPTR